MTTVQLKILGILIWIHFIGFALYIFQFCH